MSFYGAYSNGRVLCENRHDNMVCSPTGTVGESATGDQRKATCGHARRDGFQGVQS